MMHKGPSVPPNLMAASSIRDTASDGVIKNRFHSQQFGSMGTEGFSDKRESVGLMQRGCHLNLLYASCVNSFMLNRAES